MLEQLTAEAASDIATLLGQTVTHRDLNHRGPLTIVGTHVEHGTLFLAAEKRDSQLKIVDEAGNFFRWHPPATCNA